MPCTILQSGLVLSPLSHIFLIVSLNSRLQRVKVNTTLMAILRGSWLIDRMEAQNYLPIIANVIHGNTEFERVQPQLTLQVVAGTKSSSITINDNWDLNSVIRNEEIAEGATVTIPIRGTLMKDDVDCGPVGMVHIAAVVDRLSQIENVNAIIFDIDSPGGMVDGTQTLAQSIAKSTKRTIAHINDGMAASAAYWLACSANEIFASQKTDVFGSIGVYVTLADFKAFYEAEGLKIHEIYSNHSDEKNKDYKDALAGKPEAIKSKLDFIAETFIAHVKNNRHINLAEGNPFKGATYFAEQAQAIGLIDGIKSKNELFAHIASEKAILEDLNETPETLDNTSEMNIKDKLAAYAAAQSDDERNAIVQEVEIAFGAEEVFTQKEFDAALEISTATSQAKITSLENELDDLKKPAAVVTTATAEEDPQFGGDKKEYRIKAN